MTKLALLMLLVGCSTSPPAGSVLNIDTDSHTIAVGPTMMIFAYFDDGEGAMPSPISASWSLNPNGIVTLAGAGNNVQTLSAVAVGQVVVTADSEGQTAETGFTVVSM